MIITLNGLSFIMPEFRVVPFSSLSKEQKLKAASIGWGSFKEVPNPLSLFIAKRISHDGGLAFTLLKGNEPMGYIAARIKKSGLQKTVIVSHLFTKNSIALYRKTGKTVGETLAEEVVKKALEKGCTKLGATLANKQAKRLLVRHVKRGALQPSKSLNPLTKRYKLRRP